MSGCAEAWRQRQTRFITLLWLRHIHWSKTGAHCKLLVQMHISFVIWLSSLNHFESNNECMKDLKKIDSSNFHLLDFFSFSKFWFFEFLKFRTFVISNFWDFALFWSRNLCMFRLFRLNCFQCCLLLFIFKMEGNKEKS